MFLGSGAEVLADKYNIEKVENDYFYTQKRYDDWVKARTTGIFHFPWAHLKFTFDHLSNYTR